MTLGEIVSIIKDTGTLGVLILIIVSGAQGRWVWGYQFRAALREKDEWKELALRGTSLAEGASVFAMQKDREARVARDRDRDA